MRIRLAVGIVAAGLCAAGLRLAWSSKDVPVAPPERGQVQLPEHGFAGTTSCSAAACHGKPEPIVTQAAQQNEYTVLLAHDKHMRAYDSLLSERAQQMAENLAKAPGAKLIPAHLDERCLACHSTPQAAKLPAGQTEPNAALLSWRQGGVSCEACHGPALGPKPWLADHTIDAWKKLTPKQKVDYGMTNLVDVRVRAQVCAGCHVGARPENGIPARDLHHDLMAAGHPRLSFELASYRANVPVHWNAKLKAEQQKDPDHEASIWAVGRMASARAALDLLVHRAEQALLAKKTPGQTVRWPEFAEYRCFACHADFNNHWKLRDGDTKRPPGSLPYDPWHYTLLPELSKVRAGFTGDVKASYDELIAEMAKPQPDETTVIDTAKKLIASHDAWLAAVETGSFARELRGKLAESQKAIPPTWEAATQLALAAAALQPGERAILNGLFEALAYPPGAESPAGFLGPNGSRKVVEGGFAKLLEMLKK